MPHTTVHRWLSPLAVGSILTLVLPTAAAARTTTPTAVPHASAQERVETSVVGWRTEENYATEPVVRVPTTVRSGTARVTRTLRLQSTPTADGEWQTISTITTSPRGRATVRLPVEVPAYYRLIVPATGRYARTVSGTRWYHYVPRGVRGRLAAVSVTPQGKTGDGASWGPRVSPDGTKVAFTSLASDLTPSRRGGAHPDVFVRDLRQGTTQLVSRSADGTPGDGPSGLPQWLPNSREIVFASTAGNWGQPAGAGDVWIKNIATGTLRKVGSTGVTWPASMASYVRATSSPGFPQYNPLLLSPDGRTVASHVDPTRDPDFGCTPRPTDPWATGSCTDSALGTVDLSDGRVRVKDGGVVHPSGSGPTEDFADALTWLRDSRHLVTSSWASCYHCNEGPLLEVLDVASLTQTSVANCGHAASCSTVRASAPRADGWFAMARWIYGYPGANPLAGLSLTDSVGRYDPLRVATRYPAGDLQFGAFSPSDAALALQLDVDRPHVQALRVGSGALRTWSADARGDILRRGGTDPHWVSDTAIAFVTGDPAAIRRDTNRATDVVIKTRR